MTEKIGDGLSFKKKTRRNQRKRGIENKTNDVKKRFIFIMAIMVFSDLFHILNF
jgi:hypothetical protein